MAFILPQGDGGRAFKSRRRKHSMIFVGKPLQGSGKAAANSIVSDPLAFCEGPRGIAGCRVGDAASLACPDSRATLKAVSARKSRVRFMEPAR